MSACLPAHMCARTCGCMYMCLDITYCWLPLELIEFPVYIPLPFLCALVRYRPFVRDRPRPVMRSKARLGCLKSTTWRRDPRTVQSLNTEMWSLTPSPRRTEWEQRNVKELTGCLFAEDFGCGVRNHIFNASLNQNCFSNMFLSNRETSGRHDAPQLDAVVNIWRPLDSSGVLTE